MKNIINSNSIKKIVLNHNLNVVDIMLSNETLFSISEIMEFIKEYSNLFSDNYKVNIFYLNKFENIPEDIIKENIYYLFKYFSNSLSNDFNLDNILIENNDVLITLNSKIIVDKILKNNTLNQISKLHNIIYKESFNLVLDYKKQENKNIDLNKELDEIIKETNINNLKNLNNVNKTLKPSKNMESVILGKKINDISINIADITEAEGYDCIIQGEIISIELKNIKKDLVICQIDITDHTNSITSKSFIRKSEIIDKLSCLCKGNQIKIKGKMNYDSYAKEYVLLTNSINIITIDDKMIDKSIEKRVELHVHSKMSSMDGISVFDELAKRAKEWGHKAIAITDHGVLQGYPDAMQSAKDHDIKVIYGVEGYLTDDSIEIIKNATEQNFDEAIIVFDLETTGLSPIKDKIIEIGAVKIINREIVEEFNILVNPGISIPQNITKLTGISNEDVKECLGIKECLDEFFKFVGNSNIICAHNAKFDYSFLRNNTKHLREFCIIDTLDLSRALVKKKKSYKLNKLCEYFNITLDNNHRASDDARATGELLLKLLEILENKEITNYSEINFKLAEEVNIKNSRYYHIIILVKNYIGLKNLYKMVSESHLNYFYKKPRIPKSLLNKYKEGLILGTACEAGELYSSVLSGSNEAELDKIVELYDFVEIQPISNNLHLIKNGLLKDKNDLMEINKKLVQIAKRNNKIICATGDVHFLEPRDYIIREILMSGQGYEDASDQPPLYLKTTEEMMSEFIYLGPEICKEAVIYGPNIIADMVEENIKPIPDGTYPPIIEGSDDSLRQMTINNAINKYGSPLPEIVKNRLDRELNSIISNGYAVMYIIAQKLVERSLKDGYLVGSRGSVGSSFVATMSNITEVNPLPPHYVCNNCKNSEFIEDGSYGSGIDLPSKKCPKCGNEYSKDGHDIPFEVFLGFEGDKEPDIDLNFAAKEQIEAMRYSEELFGEGYVFRAGTIGTIASKTAYGFVKNYHDEKNLKLRNAELNRLINYCTGVKKTTGQHPGGVMIVPKNKDIYDFTPIQYPANNSKSGVITTHFDYHSISGRILKLDILGHDTPTIIKMLEDFTGLKNSEIPLDNPETLSLFESPNALGITKDDINCETGTLGIPEFGTSFVRQMLMDTKPKSFSDLVIISGLAHGTDVWINNAQDLIKNGTTTIKEVISTRDDIMIYLIQKGMDKKKSFDIMERVRKGKGLREEDVETMNNSNVPKWYIDSCNKIKYMFPKAHAVAYVTMSVKIAYFKVHYPLAFYASYFTMKAVDFDADIIIKGKDEIYNTLMEINKKENKTQKEKSLSTVLEVAYEMYMRGFSIEKVNLYESDYKEFKIIDGKLLPPFISIQGLGESAAINIQKEREKSEFISIEDLVDRAKINKSCIDVLKNHGSLNGLDKSNQISLFNI